MNNFKIAKMHLVLYESLLYQSTLPWTDLCGSLFSPRYRFSTTLSVSPVLYLLLAPTLAYREWQVSGEC